MSLHPRSLDLTLDRICGGFWQRLATRNASAPVIHIAGTNARGSTLAMLRAGALWRRRNPGARLYTLARIWIAVSRVGLYLAGRILPSPILAARLNECEPVMAACLITLFRDYDGSPRFLGFAPDACRLGCCWRWGLAGGLDAD